MKKLTLKQRADVFLDQVEYQPEKWILVKNYQRPRTARSWKKEYEKLHKHHLAETFFLFSMLMELKHRLRPPPPPAKVGDQVTVPWWESKAGAIKAKRVRNLNGKIVAINGAYHYVKIKGNPKYDVLELYPNEFRILKSGKRKLRTKNSPRKR